MANLIQAAEELEFVPKTQLAQMSQDPNSRYPSFLVLSEIQRRTQMERMYNAERQAMEKPTTTVAEEKVAELMQPQGLAGMGVNGSAEAPTADVFSPDQPMPASPMQYAASGGRTGFQNIGATSLGPVHRSRQSLLASLGIDPSGMTEEEIEQALLQGGVQRGIRNNNPLNIRYDSANDWQGQIGKDDEGFAIFETPDYGIRAGDRILENYDELHGIDTISEITERFAPASDDNDPEAYADFIASRTGMGADERIDLSNPATRQSILTAQSAFETPQIDTLTGEAPTLGRADLQSYQAAREAQAGKPTVPQLGDTDDSGGLGAAARWVKEKARERYFGDDDKFKLGTAALDASLLIPGAGLLAGAGARAAFLGGRAVKAAHAAGKFGEWGRKGVELAGAAGRGLGRGARATVTRPRTITRGTTGPGGEAARRLGLVDVAGNVIAGSAGRQFATRRAAATGAGLLAAGTAVEYIMDDDEVEEKVAGIVNPPGGPPSPELEKSTKGLSGKVNSYLKQADGLDVAKLGGIIMSSRNTVELGEGITALAQDIQTRKTEEEARQDELKLRDIQGELYRAQTDKVYAEIEDMPLEQINDLLSAYAEYHKGITEGYYQMSENELSDFNLKYLALLKKSGELQGIGSLADDRADPYAESGVTIGP